MCGFCGIYNYGNSPSYDEKRIIIDMRDSMIHRGPDDTGIYLSNQGTGFRVHPEPLRYGTGGSEDSSNYQLPITNYQLPSVALGHRRLSIIDLSSAGHQPMTNEDQTIWIAYNGEIYNFTELMQELKSRGHRFRSRTDTEIIIHLYEEKGIECLKSLRGMFAFALWDSRKKALYLARDRIGIKPLFYSAHNGRLIFASEIKAILRHPSISRDLDHESLYHYLTLCAVPAPKTLFKGIFKLPAGTFLRCDDKGSIRIERYWDPRSYLLCPEALKDPEERVDAVLSESIRMRTVSDVPMGVLLSGGIDSSTVVAYLAREDIRMKTFSIAFEDDLGENEFEFSRLIAETFGTEHEELVIPSISFDDFVDGLTLQMDEPIADTACVAFYFLARAVKEMGITVGLVGEGGDEVFLGYDHYRRLLRSFRYFFGPYTSLPPHLKRLGYHILKRILPIAKADHLYRVTDNEDVPFLSIFGFNELEKGLTMGRQFNDLRINEGWPSTYELLMNLILENNHGEQLSFFARMNTLDFIMGLPELLLMKVDKFSMSSSMEVRVPFLDHKLVEIVLSLPQGTRYRGMRNKYLFKKILRNTLPPSILDRPKQGFMLPIREWVRTSCEKNGMVRKYLLETRYMNELFQHDLLRTLVYEHISGAKDNCFRLWNLFTFSLWYQKWLIGNR